MKDNRQIRLAKSILESAGYNFSRRVNDKEGSLKVEDILRLFNNSKNHTEYYNDGTTRDRNVVHDALFDISLKLTDQELNPILNRTEKYWKDYAWMKPRYGSITLGGNSYRAINLGKSDDEVCYFIRRDLIKYYDQLGTIKDGDSELTFFERDNDIAVISKNRYENSPDNKLALLDKKKLKELLASAADVE